MTGERSNEERPAREWTSSSLCCGNAADHSVHVLVDDLRAVRVERDALRERFADLQAEHQKIAATQDRIRNLLTAERDEARARAAALQTAIEHVRSWHANTGKAGICGDVCDECDQPWSSGAGRVQAGCPTVQILDAAAAAAGAVPPVNEEEKP